MYIFLTFLSVSGKLVSSLKIIKKITCMNISNELPEQSAIQPHHVNDSLQWQIQNSIDVFLSTHSSANQSTNRGALYQSLLVAIERSLFHRVMQLMENNQSHAAAALGISRATLSVKLKRYGLR